MNPVAIYKGVKIATKVAAFVSGFFGSRRKRKEEAEKRANFGKLLSRQNELLRSAVPEVREEYAQRDVMDEAAMTNVQESEILQYGDKRGTVESNIARSGLAGVGSGEQALQNYDELFQLQQAKAALSAESRKFERDLRLRGRERSIASAGFALDKAAAEKGLKTSYGSSLMDLTNLG